MIQPGVSDDIKAKIWAAADRLAARGAKITNEAVRQECGGKHSYSHISPAMQAWKRRREENQAVLHNLPSGMVSVVERFAQELWDAAQESQANTKADAALIRDLVKQKDEALDSIEVLKEKNYELRVQVERYKMQFKDYEKRIEELQSVRPSKKKS